MVRVMKRLTAITVILLIILMSGLCFPHYAWGAAQHMYDDSGILYDSEVAEIDRYLADLSEELEFDIIGVMIDEGYDEDDLRAFADDFYDYGGFGYGEEHDGVIFVVDMESRLMMLVSTGFGITAITDYGEELIYDYVTDDLRNENFVSAFEGYGDAVREFVYEAREGTPVDVDGGGQDDGEGYDYERSLPSAEEAAGMGGISLVAGAGVGFFSSQRQKSKLKTVRRKTQANSYARRDSLVLTRKQDRFLYSTVAVVPRPKNNNNHHSHPGGGGTTIHMGSSGVPHGGGHGRGF